MANSFLKLIHLPEAVRSLLENLPGPVEGHEEWPASEAAGRVTSEDVVSPEDLPGFDRSSMDGFAVRARDTFGAGEGMPAYVELVGEVPMGSAGDVSVHDGQAVRISTGGLMPAGADAVVMVENTELSGSTVEVVKSVAPGDNTIARDEDFKAGDLLLRKGMVIGAPQVGALAGTGTGTLKVYRLPVVGVISTGDELVAAGARPAPGQVRDVNGVALAVSIREAGCVPRVYGIVKDDLDALLDAARRGLAECDALLISGGSSVGVRDMTLDVINALGEPGLIAHGVYLKPGKPTLIAVSDGKPVIGLPGNPASALAVFRELIVPALGKLRGELPRPWAYRAATVEARLDRSVSSPPGRVELVPVALSESEDGIIARPIFGKSNLIGTLSRAQGQVRIPLGCEGIERGAVVTVELLE
jgi:molybdopterin molybdotransferase